MKIVDKILGLVSKFKLYIIIGVASVLLALVGYFFWSQSEIAELNKQNAAYELETKSLKESIDSLEKNIKLVQAAQARLLDIERNDSREAEKLTEKVKSATQDVDKLNAHLRQRERCFALATGAVPLKNEVNTVCPQLLVIHNEK